MGSDTKAKFGFTTFIRLEAEPSGIYGSVVSIPTASVNPLTDGVYGGVVSVPVAEVELSGVYGQVSPITMSFINLSGVYGQVSNVPMLFTNSAEVYGQVVSTHTKLLGLQASSVYGQVVALSGFGPITLATNIQGVGDIIYYGDTADLNLEGGEFFAVFDNQVDMSGMAAPIAPQGALSPQDSNSIIFAASGVSILPSAEVGVHLFFSNYNGQALAVSGADPIVTANVTANLVSVSGVGSHLGLIGVGSKWIATEESGVV